MEYIKYVYEKKDSALKPNVRRIVRAYNEVFKDRLKRPLSENLCACNLRPYLIELYRKLLPLIYPQYNIINVKEENEKTENEVRTVENVKQPKSKKNAKTKNKQKQEKVT